MGKKILITGGAGTVGMRLTALLQEAGHQVSHLSRNLQDNPKVKTYFWDLSSGYVDPQAIAHNDIIVHLAGAGVFDSAWSKEYRKQILDSRVQSARLLADCVAKQNKKLDAFISASAIGIYGAQTTEQWMTEDSPAADGFLSDVVKQWEAVADGFTTMGIRVAKIRIGIVLSKKGGALEQMAAPVRYGLGAALGSGKQWIPWIHIDDLCRIFVKAIEDEQLQGVYNAASPNPVTNKQFMDAIAKALHRPMFLPNVPSFALEMALGKEKASFILGGSRVSTQKILSANFSFQYPEVKEALANLL